jgi:predicted PurR-regulated permease PerM
MTESQQPAAGRPEPSATIELVVRLGVLVILVAWCFKIMAPFVGPVAWGIIIAVAAAGAFSRLERFVGGRSSLAAALFVLFALLLLIVPAVILSETLVSGAQQVAEQLSAGTIDVPPPPDEVAHWPFIGDAIYPIWDLASENLEAALNKVQPQLKQLGLALLSAAGSAGIGILQFLLSIIIAAVLLANATSGQRFAHLLAEKLAGERGEELATLARATVSSVATGIVGVALLQALLAGLGFVAVGLPAAGLWAAMVLLFAIVQLPIPIVMIPIIVYVFASASTPVAVVFTIWAVFVSVIDNFLKPILFGRGAKVPTLVIFIGSIGGMLTSGIIGLFIGSVILAVGYAVFRAWLGAEPSS